jgi:hypothetical protein
VTAFFGTIHCGFRSVMRGYGSIDFQLLLFEYIKEEPNEELFASVEREYQLLGFMFGTATLVI